MNKKGICWGIKLRSPGLDSDTDRFWGSVTFTETWFLSISRLCLTPGWLYPHVSPNDSNFSKLFPHGGKIAAQLQPLILSESPSSNPACPAGFWLSHVPNSESFTVSGAGLKGWLRPISCAQPWRWGDPMEPHGLRVEEVWTSTQKIRGFYLKRGNKCWGIKLSGPTMA